MSSDPAVNAAAIIANHLPLHGEYRTGNVGCTCGWEALVQVDEWVMDLDVEKSKVFAAHVVAAIRDSGYTVIALPEPTSSDDTGTEWHSSTANREGLTSPALVASARSKPTGNLSTGGWSQVMHGDMSMTNPRPASACTRRATAARTTTTTLTGCSPKGTRHDI